MKILVEGEDYPLVKLSSIISDKFYKTSNNVGIINHVGYFYSFVNKEVVYILPKVFIGDDKKILFKYDKDELLNDELDSSDLKYFMILFYRSLIEYRKRELNSILVQKNETLVLDSNIGENEYSFLDIVLNLVNFHKEHKTTLLFIEKKYQSSQHKKVSWAKTIRKTLPFFTKHQEPIYVQSYNKKKVIDSEERLLTLFYSVLNDIKKEYKFSIKIDNIYTIYTGKKYKQLCKKAPKLLREIKYKYFSDILKKVYKLMELYFEINNYAKAKKRTNEFILVDKYNIIFEDMIDNLFSDTLPKKLKKLKNHDDGKEVDHIFEYDGLLDNEESIFYIGDSKYYKTGAKIGTNSKYKQFTYAKNIIQFNIDVLNKEEVINERIRYRDSLTEGYNISPNFFIQGIISEEMDYKKVDLKLLDKAPEKMVHFKNRLFDRDTLIVHYYSINFLYVLKSYSQHNSLEIELFKKHSRKEFKTTLVDYLNDSYDFYFKDFTEVSESYVEDIPLAYGERRTDSSETIESFVNKNFKVYNGRMYRREREPLKLIFANEKDSTDSIDGFEKFRLGN